MTDIDKMMQNVRKIRDEKRPKMETVVDTLDEIFSRADVDEEIDIHQHDRGPYTWSWVDMAQADLGFQKWYVLSHSTMEGTEGYPLITIRMTTAPRLDAWLTVSQLVVGPDPKSIETSLAMAIANLNGAFMGLRQMVNQTVDRLEDNPEDFLDKMATRSELN